MDCCRSVGLLLANQSSTEFFSYMPLRVWIVILPTENEERSWVVGKVHDASEGSSTSETEKL